VTAGKDDNDNENNDVTLLPFENGDNGEKKENGRKLPR